MMTKYYPTGELVDIVFPTEVSPTWKAIEHGVELVKKGIIWCIQLGTKVQIWRDNPWLPSKPSMKITLKKGRRWVS
jgi:hypothetical protein